MDVEQRIRRLEDRIAISDLVVSYFVASDDDDSEGVAASFTADATFSSSGQLNAQGRDGIVEFIKSARSHMGMTVHTPNYVQCRFESPDRATGIVGAHLELVVGSVSVFGVVRYVDSYVRDGDVWRFQSRDMRVIRKRSLSPTLRV
ncbi:nuclear transport factor 2 family protein [Sphingobium phenoxybenzoativorans]|uniref:Nuclear transport factor 2 family protein n=1 Tax=Sphingobium phenoxybenzoativorans TaxID=1592790 RepID=A0A975Q178_9SPHN|nr:nuclear transport factor 2 family protein [Sphingobium phenoxybenzoativorans]QUT05514.1 nuclear transport factor 2 family protein [Sphingobium phenoxybenzoativorans]